jgi:hypothetical protein
MASSPEPPWIPFDETSYRDAFRTQLQPLSVGWQRSSGRSARKFYPDGCLDYIVTAEALQKLMRAEGAPEIDPDMIRYILSSAKKLFVLLFVSGFDGEIYRAIKAFKRHNLSDSSLPFEDRPYDREDLRQKLGFRFSPWRKLNEWQYQFLSPVFDGAVFQYDFRPLAPLPFIEASSTIKDGPFGQLSQVKIHPAHLKNPVMLRLLCYAILYPLLMKLRATNLSCREARILTVLPSRSTNPLNMSRTKARETCDEKGYGKGSANAWRHLHSFATHIWSNVKLRSHTLGITYCSGGRPAARAWQISFRTLRRRLWMQSLSRKLFSKLEESLTHYLSSRPAS